MILLFLLMALVSLALICTPFLFEGCEKIFSYSQRQKIHFKEALEGVLGCPSDSHISMLFSARLVALVFALPVALGFNFFLGIAILLLAFYIPKFLITRLRNQHLASVNEDLPDAVAILVRSVRSQGSLARAIDDVVLHSRGAIAYEFSIISKEHSTFGLPLATVLERARVRVPVEGFRMMTSALNVSLRNGGDLPIVLEGIASSTREISQLQKKIAVESSQILSQMKIMIPAAAGALILSGFFQKGAYEFIFSTFWGNVLLLVICVVQFIAWKWVKQIVRRLV
jgi:tight adherence protein B